MFFAFVMMFSSAVPTMTATRGDMAAPIATIEMQEVQEVSIDDGYIGIAPLTEVTTIHFTNFNGVLHFRVWGVTSGRWLTEWQPLLG